jgi:hypothetical protein
MGLVLRRLIIYEDYTVSVSLSASIDSLTPITMTCLIGDGAFAHEIVQGNDL